MEQQSKSKEAEASINVIGLACRFPESQSTFKFWDNLKEGRDMITKDDAHWPNTLNGALPEGKGVLHNQDCFDNLFFKMSGVQAAKVDPQLRFLLELSYEALVDAGFDDFAKLKGTKTGVFVGSCFSDCHKGWVADVNDVTGYENTGCAQSMYANRLSYFYDFRGPSMNIDTACSSSLVALVEACKSMEYGDCEMAIIGGSSVTLHPGISVAFNRLHMLSPDSACQSFAKSGNGYCRSEGVAVVVLCKKDMPEFVKQCLSYRVPYCSLLGFGINSDGFTSKGITFPNGEAQYELYREVSKKIDVRDVAYIEAHGTGTKAGDGQELEALRKCYLPDDIHAEKKRLEKPALLIGSVKSNMGHAEGASGLAGLVKVLLSYENKMLPANLHYTYEERNPNCPILDDPTHGVKVVEENLEFEGGIVAVSSFGFGGTNAHILVDNSEWRKKDIVLATSDEDVLAAEPWLNVNPVCARTETTAHELSKFLRAKKVEFASSVSPPTISGNEFPIAAYSNHNGDVFVEESSETTKPPVYLCFSGNGGMWAGMGKELYHKSAIYKATYDQCSKHLKEAHNCDSLDKFLLEEKLETSAYSALDGVTGLAAVQMCLVNLLRFLNVDVEGYVGHSAGETAMGYVDGVLTLEETMSVAYYRGICGGDTVDKENPGAMYAVGLSRMDAESLIEKYNCEYSCVGCDNDPTLVTLSGLEKELEPLIAEIKTYKDQSGKPVFCRKVPTFGVAFHSRVLEPGLEKLKKQLQSVITNPKKRSAKWISTCYDDSKLAEEDEGRYLSADYHCYNFRHCVNFYDAVKTLPPNAVVLEVGPHALFRASIKKISAFEKKPLTYIPLMVRDKDCFHYFEQAYGSLLMKKVCEVPVQVQGSGSILQFTDREVREAFITWNHDTKYPLPTLEKLMANPGLEDGGESGVTSGVSVSFDLEGDDAFILDHVIDNTVLMPACGYVYAAWRAFATHTKRKNKQLGLESVGLENVVLSDLKIHQGIRLDETNRQLVLNVKFDYNNGFEINYESDLIVSGGIKIMKVAETKSLAVDGEKAKPSNKDWPVAFDNKPVRSSTFEHELGSLDESTFYNRIGRNGYNYKDRFRLVESISIDDSWAYVNFDRDMYVEKVDAARKKDEVVEEVLANKCWIAYLDNLLQVSLLKEMSSEDTSLRVPTEIREISIRGANFMKMFPSDGGDMKNVMSGETVQSADSGTSTEFGFVDVGPVLVKIHPHLNQVTSALADIVDLKTSFMARASEKTKLHEEQTHVGGKQYFDLLKPNMGLKERAAIAVAFEYVKEHCEELVILDYEPKMVANKELVQHFGVETMCVKFEEDSVKAEYEKTFPGLYAEYDGSKKYNLVMTSDLLLSQTVNEGFSLKNFVEKNMFNESSFVLFNESSAEIFGADLQNEANLQPVLKFHTLDGRFVWLCKSRQVEESGKIALLPLISLLPENSLVTQYELSGAAIVDEVLPTLKKLVEEKEKVFVVSNASGLSGFIKCLQREPGFEKVRGVMIEEMDNATLLKTLNRAPCAGSLVVAEQRIGEIVLGARGIRELEEVDARFAYWNVEERKLKVELMNTSTFVPKFVAPFGKYVVFPNPGNLEEYKFKAQPSYKIQAKKFNNDDASGMTEVEIAYAALNFRDVMLAYNKIDRDALVGHSKHGDGWGLEFSGRTESKKVMGLSCNSIGDKVTVNKNLLWELREDQSLEDYATVPCVYATVYYSLFVRANMKPSNSILIHAGAGGVGQAALYVTLTRTKNPSLIFTTCSAKKRGYLMDKFGPLGLEERNIGNTRDCSFEDMIMERTEGKGVNVVLNSLSDEKLQASVRCLAPFGKFCEIGKYDIMQNHGLGMSCLLKNISVMGIDLDQLLDQNEEWEEVHNLVSAGLANGEIRPLDRKVFDNSEITEAFRFMGAGTHMGKVLVDFSTKSTTKESDIPNFSADFDYMLQKPIDSQYPFLIVGGMGGFGLELAKWLSVRGVSKIILSSRCSTPRSGTQAKYLQEINENCKVSIVDLDFTNYQNVCDFLERTKIGGFFNLGIVLADGLFSNMKPKQWDTPLAAKIAITENFHRALGDDSTCRHFVTFSSVSAGFGNAGQTNYGYANSYLDELAKKRVASNKPSLSIQWGVIGDVGLLAKSDSKKSGSIKTYLPQAINHCLKEMEKLLVVGQQGVCMTYVTAKRQSADGEEGVGKSSLLEKVAKIVGVVLTEDAKSPAEATTFENLGVDSLQLMEIQNTLKKGNKNVGIDTLQKMSLKDLKAMEEA